MPEKKNVKKRIAGYSLVIGFVLLGLVILGGCSRGKSTRESQSTAISPGQSYDIAVFVPGVTAGSPLYEQMVAGVEDAAKTNSAITVKILEAGFNQGEWKEKLMSLAAEEKYELIVSDNGAMPYVALPVAESFPEQKFLFVDAIIKPHKQMYTLLYNQIEEGYIIGYLGGLITKSSMKGINKDLKIGVIAGQEFPAMTQMIIPGYRMGAEAADKETIVDYRVLGNWYDANKARELALSMIDSGVDVILAICGGANQGIITAAREKGIYVLAFDSDQYDLAPGTIAGSVTLDQRRAVRELVQKAYKGDLQWGQSIIVGVKEGYVGLAGDNPLYAETVPLEIRKAVDMKIGELKEGKVVLEVPEFWNN